MSGDLFSLKQFNVIQDDQYYYVFRALNRADHNDISSGVTAKDGKIERIRTDRERWLEKNKRGKYSATSEVSLEEMWNHIKVRYSHDTNCISLSSNANVSLDYGNYYNNEYVVVKILKKNPSNVYFAGQYMLNEIANEIDSFLKENNIPLSIQMLLNRITNETDNAELLKIVLNFKKESNSSKDIMSRFQNRQYFNAQQQLEYNKIIAKATILELSGLAPSILKTTSDNSSLIGTVGNAFSSGEIVHYNDIFQNEFQSVSKQMMVLLGIVQQLKEKNNTEEVKKLESLVISLINGGYDFKNINGKVVLTNGKQTIDCNLSTKDSVILENKDIDEKLLTLSQIYSITNGSIDYQEAQKMIRFCHYLSLSRLEVHDYAKVVSSLLHSNQLTDVILNQTYSVHNSIVNRGNGNGHKVCESVNIGMDYKPGDFIDKNQENYLFSMIQNSSLEDLKKQVDSNGLFYRDAILDLAQNVCVLQPKNVYYAQTVVNALNNRQVFSTNNLRVEFSKEEKERLINDLSKFDITNLFDSLEKEGLSYSQAAIIILNLFLEKSYNGKTFAELCTNDNMEQFVHDNLNKFNTTVNRYALNQYLGVLEEQNIIPNSYINLRDYQMNIKQNIDSIYSAGRRFAGVVLPTGGGKSFVTMAEMLNKRDSNIVYVAPRKEILRQFKKHIVKYVAGKDPKGYSDQEINQIVSFCFPHLQLCCYQSFDAEDEVKLDKFKADLIILDEIHHIGAESWNPAIRSLIDRSKNCKVLGLSATPVRDNVKPDDPYQGDMMLYMANYLDDYSPEELLSENYLASNMDISTAAQEGFIIPPDIVSFDYNLSESTTYMDILHAVLKNSSGDKAQINEYLNDLQDVINNAKIVGVSEIIKRYLKKKDGKYILFIPRNPNPDISTEEYFQQQIAEMSEILKEIDIEPHFEYLYSARGDYENSEALRRFEQDDSNRMKIIVAIDMLSEGVHFPVNGSFNFRKIGANSMGLATQHLGRVIHGVDPTKTYDNQDVPVVFDKFNTFFNLNINRFYNRSSVNSDLQKMKDVAFFIKKYGYIPDVDSKYSSEKRYAYNLKKIQRKYRPFLESPNHIYKNMSRQEQKKLGEILDIGNTFDLWNYNFPSSDLADEEENTQVKVFKANATQKRFLDLCHTIKEICQVSNQSKKARITEALNVFDFLAEYNYPFNLSQIQLNSTLEDAIQFFDEETREQLIHEFQANGISLKYPFGESFNFIRNELSKANSEVYKNSAFVSLSQLRQYGLFQNDRYYTFTDDYDFLLLGPIKYRYMNINTNSYFDESGFDIRGFDRHSFNRAGIHKKTRRSRDPYGFDCHCINLYTETIYDRHGFDIDGINKDTNSTTDKRGFNRAGFFQEYRRYDDTGYDIDGYNFRGFDKNGINRITHEPYDWNFFDNDGYYWEEQGNHRVKTNRKYDETMHNCNGNKVIITKNNKVIVQRQEYDKHGFNLNGIHHKTKTRYDLRGFDRNGYWYRKDKTGAIISTGKKFNDAGWNIDHQTLRYNAMGGTFLDYVDDRGFDEQGYYHTPLTKYQGRQFTEFNGGTIMYSEHGRRGKDSRIDIHGFDSDGINIVTRTNIDARGFDQAGFWHRPKGNGMFVNTHQYFDDKGWTIDKFCFLPKAKCYSKINESGFDADGFYIHNGQKLKYNLLGFDCNGLHRTTGTNLDSDNFDINGYYYRQDKTGQYVNTGKKYNDDGWSQQHTNIKTLRVVDEHGFNYLHLYRKKDGTFTVYDNNGFDYYGIHRTTHTKINRNHFDQDGYWYRKDENGNYVSTGQKYDDSGYNIKRLDARNFSRNGYYNGRSKRYDSNDFDVNGINAYTNKNYDLDGLDCYGQPVEGYDKALVEKIKAKIRFQNRLLLDDVYNDLSDSEKQELLQAVDISDDEIDWDNEHLLHFIDYAVNYCVTDKETSCTEEETIDFIKDKAYEQDGSRRNKEKHDIYPYFFDYSDVPYIDRVHSTVAPYTDDIDYRDVMDVINRRR